MTRFLALPSDQRWFLLRCLAVVVTVRVMLSLSMFALVRRRIAALQARGAASPELLKRVAWAVSATARLVPGATCLTQALAGQYLLASQGAASEIRIGVEDGTAELRAHAWLVCAGTVVLGGSSSLMGRYRHLAELRT